MRLVEVEWVDSISHCESPWRSPDELREKIEPNVCRSAGYLFGEDDEEHVTVVMSHGSFGEEVGMAITIPRVCVRAVHDLSRVYEPIVLT